MTKRTAAIAELSTPEKPSSSTRRNVQTPPPSSPFQQLRPGTTEPLVETLPATGAEFNLDEDVFSHPKYVSNIPGPFRWETLLSASQKSLCNNERKTINMLIAGKVNDAKCGLYGDFSDRYHTSLVKGGIRNYSFRLSAMEGRIDKFVQMTEKLGEMSHSVAENFEQRAGTDQLVVKNSSQIELKRKIAQKAPNSVVGFVPDDNESRIVN